MDPRVSALPKFIVKRKMLDVGLISSTNYSCLLEDNIPEIDRPISTKHSHLCFNTTQDEYLRTAQSVRSAARYKFMTAKNFIDPTHQNQIQQIIEKRRLNGDVAKFRIKPLTQVIRERRMLQQGVSQ
ncbi:Hypothetical_protein [Hexamita inflata]|uniref:Hypothetical_protein n=1 Tax=Hexamita inflata TaxID=28002 RepID=A0ABP1HKC8_9EUKA